MQSHSIKHVERGDVISKKNEHPTDLPPALHSLLMIAKKKYDSYMDIAQKFDDSQERFCSTAVNTLKANELIAKIALRSKQITENA